ncbi:energy transducer TonB [Rhodoplanes azumiensis]|uniref:TonB family protein n=1 Tax=Rhodoplanes azumiensis TaxID=1897628 RepID=A0ABW5AL61_9BRAD
MLDVSDLRSKPAPLPAVPDLRAGPAQRPAPPPGGVVDVALPVGDNIVPLRRPSPAAAERAASLGPIDATRRPAPLAAERRRAPIVAAALVVSLAAHTGLYAWLDQPVEPLASIGLESMSVELVLGDDRPAGRAVAPSLDEAEPSEAATPAGPPDAPDSAVAELSVPDVPVPDVSVPDVSVPDAEAPAKIARAPGTAPPEVVPSSAEPATARDVPGPAEPILATVAPAVETVAAPQPSAVPDRRRPDPPPSKPAVAPAERPRKPVARPATPRGRDGRETRVAVAAPSAGSSGIGVGRSDAQSNYPGLVLAHLARFKQYPAEARAQARGGVARVRFTLDGAGRATGVALVQGSGHADLDQESVAVVRRASPFPPPPGGRPQAFTLPVRFGLR